MLFVGLFGSLTMLTAFASVKFIPVCDAITLIFTTPLFTMILAVIFMKERLTVLKIVSGKVIFNKWMLQLLMNQVLINLQIFVWNSIISKSFILAVALFGGIVLVTHPSFLFTTPKIDDNQVHLNETNASSILGNLISPGRKWWNEFQL